MTKSLCGIDCSECGFKDACGGCSQTGGRPFGGDCIVAECYKGGGQGCGGTCREEKCALREGLIAEFNALGIADMEEITHLNALKGSFVNLEFTLPNGNTVKFWDDNRIYLGNQVEKRSGGKCYGLAADEKHLMVCEYGENGTDPEIVVFKRRG